MTKMRDRLVCILLIISVIIITAIISIKGSNAASQTSAGFVIDGRQINNDLDLAIWAKSSPVSFIKSSLWQHINDGYNTSGSYLTVNGTSVYHSSAICMYHGVSSQQGAKYFISSIIDVQGDECRIYNTSDGSYELLTGAKNRKASAALGYAITKIFNYNDLSAYDQRKELIHNIYNVIKGYTNDEFFDGNEDSGSWWISEDDKAEAYAYAKQYRSNNIPSEKVDQNLKQRVIKKGNDSYIGPFKQTSGSYETKRITISVDDASNSSTSKKYYIKTPNNEFVEYSILKNGLPENQEFYVKYNGTIRKNWKVDIKYARELYKARMALLYNPANKGQQVGIYTGIESNGISNVLTWEGKVDAKFKIRKVNQQGQPVKGAQFIVYYKSGGVNKYITGYDFTEEQVTAFSSSSAKAVRFVTNSNGVVNVKGISLEGEDSRKFYIKEVYTPYGGVNRNPSNVSYQPSDEVTKGFTVYVDDENYVKNTVTAKNIEIGDLEIHKTGKNGIALDNILFKVKDKSTGKYLQIKGVNDEVSTYTISKYEDIVYTTKNNATVFKTDSTGKISIINMPAGDYVFEEWENAKEGYEKDWNKYKYGYKNEAENSSGQTGHEYDINVLKQANNVKYLQNTQELGNLKLEKRDSLATNVALEGVQFRIQIQPENETGLVNYLQLQDPYGNICIGENRPVSSATINEMNKYGNGYYSVKYVNDENVATIFTTDSSGNFYVNGLEVWYKRNTKYKYIIKECNIGNKIDLYYDTDRNLSDSNQLNANQTTLFQIKNKQLRVDLTGYIWEDIIDNSKQSIKNDHYDNGEKKIEGIPVTLYKNGVIQSQTTTNSNGEYFFPAKGTWNGRPYTIDLYATGSNDPGSGLLQYTIEFEYNGLKYQSVVRDTGTSENGSKADEKDGYRNRINENFSTILGNGSKNGTSTIGSTSTGVNLSYNSGDEDYKSKLIQYMGYTADTTLVSKNGTTSKELIKMMAEIANGTIRQHWNYGVWTVRSLNLGIYEREQTDLAIITDVDNIKMTINGYTHTYNYKNRNRFENQDNYKGQTSDYDGFLDGFSVSVKNKNTGNDYNLSYTREVYPSYIGYTDKNKNQDSKLKMFITYRIVINNQSTFLVNKVNKLKIYCDKNYNNPVSDGENKISFSKPNDTNDYRVYEVNLNDIDINPDKNLVFNITYELGTDAILQLKNGEYETARTVTEIASYTTYKDKSLYASIDKDSAPDNIKYNDTTTYEDDTDAAPGLTIKKTDDKTLEVNMFEDIKTQESSDMNEALGDGKYEDSERLVKGAKVTLLNKSTGEAAKLYTIDNNGNVSEIDANVDKLGDTGTHTFVGLIPGEYYLQYEYGTTNDRETAIINSNNKVTTEKYKSTIITNDTVKGLIDSYYKTEQWNDNVDVAKNNNGYWYQSDDIEKYSVAIDDYIKRKEINKYLSNINYSTKSSYDKITDEEKYHLITARTPLMCVAVEDKQNNSTDALSDDNGKKKYKYKSSFGIIERPIQDFEIIKEISKIKITLANGQVLVEGDPARDKMNYVTYPERGVLKVEVDNEIIQGAKLEITYAISATNKSNKNYDNKNYYLFGNDRTNLVTSKIKLIDYLDKELVQIDTDSDTWKWEAKTTESMRNKVSDDTISKGGNYNFLLPTDGAEEIEFAPGDTKHLASITASKLLSSSEEMVYDNIVEIYNLENPVGRFYDGTPGNFDFENFECDNNKYPNRAKITIVPPTGAKNMVIYVLIGIGCLVILAGGVIFIKKKIL